MVGKSLELFILF